MNKTVNYRGSKIKVQFFKEGNNRIVDKMRGDIIAEAHGTVHYSINGKPYEVHWRLKNNGKSNIRLHFEGFSCGDSEKKMIEHIISKYGC